MGVAYCDGNVKLPKCLTAGSGTLWCYQTWLAGKFPINQGLKEETYIKVKNIFIYRFIDHCPIIHAEKTKHLQ
jgi:hypothetical protein